MTTSKTTAPPKPINWKWVGAWLGTWIVLAGISEIPQAENFAAVLALTIAVSASYVYLGPNLLSTNLR